MGDAGEMVGAVMAGAFLSTSNGPKDPCDGCGAELFPATSFTVTAGMVVLLVSVPAGTVVETENDDGPTRPEPPGLSLAVHGTATSVDCHVTVGGVQARVGAVRSEVDRKRWSRRTDVVPAARYHRFNGAHAIRCCVGDHGSALRSSWNRDRSSRAIDRPGRWTRHIGSHD